MFSPRMQKKFFEYSVNTQKYHCHTVNASWCRKEWDAGIYYTQMNLENTLRERGQPPVYTLLDSTHMRKPN